MSTILFALNPITGHVRPALPVMRRLSDEGHRVLVYTGAKFADAVTRAGGVPLPMVRGRDLDDALIDEWAQAQGRPAPGPKRLQWDIRTFFVAPVPDWVADLEEAIDTHSPDVVVSDNAFIAGPVAARLKGVPSVSFFVSPLTVSSRDLAPYGLGLPPARHALDRVRYAALGWLVRRVIFGAVQREAVATIRRVGLEPPKAFLMDWGNAFATRILDTGVPGIEYRRPDLHVPVEVVGPLLPAGVDSFDPPSWWDEMLAARAKGRPVVLVTQGTVATDPSRLLLPAIEALRDGDAFVVATTATFEPDELAIPGGMPANVRLTRFVPFDRLLPHVDVALTNGGWGGVQQALAHGVPVLVAGRSEDKAEVGARVQWSGAGLALRTDRKTDAVTAAEVDRGVTAVLSDAGYTARARDLAAVYARYDGVARTAAVASALAGEPAGVRTGLGRD